MNYWIFKANPEHYRIDDRLLDPAPGITWAVTRYLERIREGDTVFIWRAGTPRGICAVMLIDSCPYTAREKDLDDGYQILPVDPEAARSNNWAKGHLVRRFPLIDTSVIKKIPGLELFSFFSAFPKATNFTLTRGEGQILLEFIEKRQAEGPGADEVNLLRPMAKPRKPLPPRAAPKKSNPVRSAGASTAVALLKCGTCGRFVVSSDTDRHMLEAHAGQPVDWKKLK